jgi:hypothetical protein
MHNYLLPMARNVLTGQTVKAQDLTGARFTLAQRRLCQVAADQLAEKITVRSGESWKGYCEPYTPTKRKP